MATRVRRKRQRLPPILLIENASDRDPLHAKVCPEAFPIKAGGKPETINLLCKNPSSILWVLYIRGISGRSNATYSIAWRNFVPGPSSGYPRIDATRQSQGGHNGATATTRLVKEGETRSGRNMGALFSNEAKV
jgi:hypothetical protein